MWYSIVIGGIDETLVSNIIGLLKDVNVKRFFILRTLEQTEIRYRSKQQYEYIEGVLVEV